MRVKLTGRWYHGSFENEIYSDLCPGVHEVPDEVGEYLCQFVWIDQVADDTPLTTHLHSPAPPAEGGGLELLAELAREVGAPVPT